MSVKLADLPDFEYYSKQEDFEDIEEYLDMSPITIDEKSLPVFKPDFSSAIIIDNIPVVGSDKHAKLQAALMKYIKQVAAVSDSDFYMPSHPETGMTYGFCFVKFASKEHADLALKILHNVAFDKKHTFHVSSYSDMDIYANINEHDQPPAFDFFPRPDVSSWLLDGLSRDQFAIRHASETEIYFSNPTHEDAALVYAGEREKSTGKKWCELNVEWSPQGTYFVTFHKPGVKLWGGEQFHAQAKFMHPQVEEISFSPCERYLITYRNADASLDNPNDAIAVWDVRTAEKLKSFARKSSLEVNYHVKYTVVEEKTLRKMKIDDDKIIVVDEANYTVVFVKSTVVGERKTSVKVDDNVSVVIEYIETRKNNSVYSVKVESVRGALMGSKNGKNDEEINVLVEGKKFIILISTQLSSEFRIMAEEKTAVQSSKDAVFVKKLIEREARGKAIAFDSTAGGFYTIEEGNTTHAGISASVVKAVQDPNKLKWSPDGNYVARLSADVISIYELPSMNLLDKKSIAAKDANDFAWSPKSNYIAYWSPAVKNLPAMINIISIPDRNLISSRKQFDVIDGKMVWHDDGDYLAVQLTKVSNKKKSYILMVFRMKVPGVPVEQVEFTEPIINCSWEPNGERLAVVFGDERSPSIHFYTMAIQAPAKAVKGKAAPPVNPGLVPLFTKSGFNFTDLQWSPAGHVVALAFFPSDACLFELFDVDNNVVMASRRHDRCNKIAWDPSGRYLATCTITELRNSHVKGRPEDGVNFFNFQGTLIHAFKKEKLHSFAWRPRPKDLLTPEERKAVVKNLSKYEKDFDQEDKVRKQQLNEELKAARFKIAKEFIEWRNRNRSLCAQLKPLRVAIRDGYDSDDDANYEIEIIVSILRISISFIIYLLSFLRLKSK